jgi:Ran-binding protein 3
MRKEAVYAVILNVTLFRGMRCELAQDPRYLRFSVIENGLTTHYNLKVYSIICSNIISTETTM